MNSKILGIVLGIALQGLTLLDAEASTGPVELQVDNLKTPLGIDDQLPRFSWQLHDPNRGARQTAYEVIYSTTTGVACETETTFSTRAISPENSPCDSEKLNYLAGGWYQDDRRLEGFAVAMPSSNFPNNKFHGDFNTDYMWRNHNIHLGARESLDGIQAKDFVWYGMPGSWDSALTFAKSLN